MRQCQKCFSIGLYVTALLLASSGCDSDLELPNRDSGTAIRDGGGRDAGPRFDEDAGRRVEDPPRPLPDAGAAEPDAGSVPPGEDAGVELPDAGAPPMGMDAGSPPPGMDAGAPRVDAGAPPTPDAGPGGPPCIECGGACCRVTTNVIDSTSRVNQTPTIALDSAAQAFIAYYDGTRRDVFYARAPISGSTFVAPVGFGRGNDRGRYSSIGLDPTSTNVRLAFYDATRQSLSVARIDGDRTWSVAGPSGPTSGQHCSLTSFADGSMRVVHFDSDAGALMYSSNGAGPWAHTRLDAATPDVGRFARIAADSTPTPHIAYLQGRRQVRHAVFRAGWQYSGVTTTSSDVVGTGLALSGPANTPCIAVAAGSRVDLHCRESVGGRWASRPIASDLSSTARSVGFAIDGMGRRIVAYRSTAGELVVLRLTGTGVERTATSTSGGDFLALGVTPAGQIAVVHDTGATGLALDRLESIR